jgi:hypothetical protein
MDKKIKMILMLPAFAILLTACGGSTEEVSTSSDTAEVTVTSSILGLADSGNKTTVKAELIKTSGPGDTNLYQYDENGKRVVIENQETYDEPGDIVSYTGEATISFGDQSEADSIDVSNAVISIGEGSGYYADEYVLDTSAVSCQVEDGHIQVTLTEGAIEWNNWGYDTSADANSNREWSIMGGDGNGVYHINLELNGVTYDGNEVDAIKIPVIVYAYGRTCTDLALSTEFEENTYDASFTSGMIPGEDVTWVWRTDNADAVIDNKPYMNDLYTDIFAVVWPAGSDASAVTAEDVTITLSDGYGEEYVLSTENAYGEQEYAVVANSAETEIFVTYQQWAMYPVFSQMTISVQSGDLTAEKTYDIASVAAWMVQTGGGGVTIDHTLTCYNYYGLDGMNLDNAVNTEYTLSATIDDTLYYYCEDETGNGYLKASAGGAPEEAWVGDATEYYGVAVNGNCVYVQTRLETTEDKVVDGETITFDQNTSFTVGTSDMVANGVSLLPGYNLSGSGVSKWAWTTRYQSGWTTYMEQPSTSPYVEGSFWYGYQPGGSNAAYDEELAADDSSDEISDSFGEGPDGELEARESTGEALEFEADPSSWIDASYTYSQPTDKGFEILWTLELSSDGTYILTEDNEYAGVKSYNGESYTIDGNTLTCGAMVDTLPGMFEWNDPNGFIVTIDGDEFTPIE